VRSILRSVNAGFAFTFGFSRIAVGIGVI
jgi:hypothetical protein